MFLFQLPETLLILYKAFVAFTCVSFWLYIFIQKKNR